MNSLFGSGKKMAMEWALISALFSGGEELTKGLRGRSDKWNRMIGTAGASAIMRIPEGPLPMAQGALMGFAFVYFFDTFATNQPDMVDKGQVTSVVKHSGVS